MKMTEHQRSSFNGAQNSDEGNENMEQPSAARVIFASSDSKIPQGSTFGFDQTKGRPKTYISERINRRGSKYLGICGHDWLTVDLAEAAKLTRTIIIKQAIRELIIYSIFLICLNLLICGYADPKKYLYKVSLDENLLKRKADETRDNTPNTPKEVINRETFWKYLLEQLLLLSVQTKEYMQPTVETKLISIPRLRQVRVKVLPCQVPLQMQSIITSCYVPYSIKNEDSSTFSLGNGTEWSYSDASVTDGDFFRYGSILYGGGGYYTDLPVESTKYKAHIRTLKENNWIDHATRAIFVDFLIYNPHLNYFAPVKIIFIFLPTGGVKAIPRIHVIKMLNEFSTYDNFLLGLEIILFTMIVYYFFESMHTACYIGWKCILQFWIVLDFAIVIIGTIAFMMREIYRITAHSAASKVLHYYDKNVTSYAMFSHNIDQTFAFLCFFCWIKILKYLGYINKTMDKIMYTLKIVLKAAMLITLLFILVAVLFALIGVRHFNAENEYHSAILNTFLELVHISLGRLRDLRGSDSIMLFFETIWINVVIFIYQGTFFILCLDTIYLLESKISAEKRFTEKLYITTFLKEWFRELFKKICCKCCWKGEKDDDDEEENTTLQEISETLAELEYSRNEIKNFMEKFDLTIHTSIGLYDLNLLSTKLSLEKNDEEPDQKDLDVMARRILKMEVATDLLNSKVDALLRKLDIFETTITRFSRDQSTAK